MFILTNKYLHETDNHSPPFHNRTVKTAIDDSFLI